MNAPFTIPTDLMTAQEAAELLQCSDETIRRKVKAGTLPGYLLVIGVRLSYSELAVHVKAAHTSQVIRSGRMQQGLRCLGEAT